MTPRSFASLVEDRLELLDRGLQLGELVAELLALELREAAQLHVEDVVGLDLGELERLGHEAGAGGRRRRPAPRIRAMMASIMSSAFTRPSTMCSRSLALRRRYSVRRVTTSIWWST